MSVCGTPSIELSHSTHLANSRPEGIHNIRAQEKLITKHFYSQFAPESCNAITPLPTPPPTLPPPPTGDLGAPDHT